MQDWCCAVWAVDKPHHPHNFAQTDNKLLRVSWTTLHCIHIWPNMVTLGSKSCDDFVSVTPLTSNSWYMLCPRMIHLLITLTVMFVVCAGSMPPGWGDYSPHAEVIHVCVIKMWLTHDARASPLCNESCAESADSDQLQLVHQLMHTMTTLCRSAIDMDVSICHIKGH